MTRVDLTDADRVDWALKVFRKKVQRAGILQDLRKKRYYVKPSVAKRLKSAAAQRRKRRGNR